MGMAIHGMRKPTTVKHSGEVAIREVSDEELDQRINREMEKFNGK
jgi:hypothetical protein